MRMFVFLVFLMSVLMFLVGIFFLGFRVLIVLILSYLRVYWLGGI